MEPLVVRDLATLGTLAGRQVYDAIRSRQMPTQAPATAAATPRAQRAKDELEAEPPLLRHPLPTAHWKRPFAPRAAPHRFRANPGPIRVISPPF